MNVVAGVIPVIMSKSAARAIFEKKQTQQSTLTLWPPT